MKLWRLSINAREQSSSPNDRQRGGSERKTERKKKTQKVWKCPGTRYLSKAQPSDLLFPRRPYLPKFTEPSKIVPLAENQAFNT
jgi:hypothetical protein